MSTPADHNESLHELELDVRTELSVAETGQPKQEDNDAAEAERLLTEDEQRYEVSLHALLGAIEAVEVDSPTVPPKPGRS
jgi:hypothetical protein